MGDAALVGELALEALGLGAETILLEQQLGLSLADDLVLGGNAPRVLLEVGLAGDELPLALGELLLLDPKVVLALVERTLAALQPHLGRAMLRLEVALLPLQL